MRLLSICAVLSVIGIFSIGFMIDRIYRIVLEVYDHYSTERYERIKREKGLPNLFFLFCLCLSLTGCANISRGMMAFGDNMKSNHYQQPSPQPQNVTLHDTNGNYYYGTVQ